ncbi:hypothetical protein HK102_003464, partial [Quaeritorhiza haematococci]
MSPTTRQSNTPSLLFTCYILLAFLPTVTSQTCVDISKTTECKEWTNLNGASQPIFVSTSFDPNWASITDVGKFDEYIRRNGDIAAMGELLRCPTLGTLANTGSASASVSARTNSNNNNNSSTSSDIPRYLKSFQCGYIIVSSASVCSSSGSAPPAPPMCDYSCSVFAGYIRTLVNSACGDVAENVKSTLLQRIGGICSAGAGGAGGCVLGVEAEATTCGFGTSSRAHITAATSFCSTNSFESCCRSVQQMNPQNSSSSSSDLPGSQQQQQTSNVPVPGSSAAPATSASDASSVGGVNGGPIVATTSSNSPGMIAGIVVGAVAFMALLAVGLISYRRYQRRKLRYFVNPSMSKNPKNFAGGAGGLGVPGQRTSASIVAAVANGAGVGSTGSLSRVYGFALSRNNSIGKEAALDGVVVGNHRLSAVSAIAQPWDRSPSRKDIAQHLASSTKAHEKARELEEELSTRFPSFDGGNNKDSLDLTNCNINMNVMMTREPSLSSTPGKDSFMTAPDTLPPAVHPRFHRRSMSVVSRFSTRSDSMSATTTICGADEDAPELPTFYRALVTESYDAIEGDEMNLHIGDVVMVYKIFEDGWGWGVNSATHQKGVFPV